MLVLAEKTPRLNNAIPNIIPRNVQAEVEIIALGHRLRTHTCVLYCCGWTRYMSSRNCRGQWCSYQSCCSGLGFQRDVISGRNPLNRLSTGVYTQY